MVVNILLLYETRIYRLDAGEENMKQRKSRKVSSLPVALIDMKKLTSLPMFSSRPTTWYDISKASANK